MTLIGAVETLSAGFAKLFGAEQIQVVEWVVVGFAVGMLIAGALSASAAWQLGEWGC